MMISTKGRYALRIMAELACRSAEGFVSLKSIAKSQEISEKYMESIISILVKNGFVEGLRGKGGGYRLTASPDEYTLMSILEATEGSLAPVSCLEQGAKKCTRSAECKTLPVWQRLDEIVSSYLSSVKLSDIC